MTNERNPTFEPSDIRSIDTLRRCVYTPYTCQTSSCLSTQSIDKRHYASSAERTDERRMQVSQSGTIRDFSVDCAWQRLARLQSDVNRDLPFDGSKLTAVCLNQDLRTRLHSSALD